MDPIRTIRDHRIATALVGALGVGLVAGALQTAGLAPGPSVVVALALFVPVANLTSSVVDVDAYIDEQGRDRILLDAVLSATTGLVAGLAVVVGLGMPAGPLAFALPVAVVFLVGSAVFFYRAREYAVTG